MPKTVKKKRQGKKRVIETALPKKQYKRTNRLFYVFSAILLVVFGGGAALLGVGAPRGGGTPAPTQAPAVVSTVTGSPADQTPGTTPSPAVSGTATTPAPAAAGTATPAPTAGGAAPTPAPATPTAKP